jgi:hypothetical protein
MSLEDVFQQLRKPFVNTNKSSRSRSHKVVEDVISKSQHQARQKEQRDGFTIGDNMSDDEKKKLFSVCRGKDASI